MAVAVCSLFMFCWGYAETRRNTFEKGSFNWNTCLARWLGWDSASRIPTMPLLLFVRCSRSAGGGGTDGGGRGGLSALCFARCSR